MRINENELFESIYDFAADLDKELEDINRKGIFFAPELYVAFGMGKQIMKKKESIFTDAQIEWGREEDLKNGGPTDIIFRNIKNTDKELLAVVELKLRDNYSAYKADIEKLLRLNDNSCKKYFCVLLDSFTTENDKRLIDLESEYQGKITRICNKSFKTNQDWYKKQVYCVLNLYRIEN